MNYYNELDPYCAHRLYNLIQHPPPRLRVLEVCPMTEQTKETDEEKLKRLWAQMPWFLIGLAVPPPLPKEPKK
jgi:hypothetical protein